MLEIDDLLKELGNDRSFKKGVYNILVIDDDRSIQRGLKTYFSSEYNVIAVDTALEGMNTLNTAFIHCIILDIKMKEMNGFRAFPKLKEIKPDIPVIFYSAFQNDHDLKTIINRYSPEGYFSKGDDIEGLKSAIDKSVKNYSSIADRSEKILDLEKKLDRERKSKFHLQQRLKSNYKFDTVIGFSPAMSRFKELCEKAVNSDITVLIEGETGTGKELAANIIHENSSRCKNGFFIQNCAAIPESLFESEFFGHIKGSFSGAVSDKKGIFELADKGTVFLDEIGEIPLQMQAKLLRLLQQGEIRPVGGDKTKYIDVRIISATNKNLAEEIKQGNFREDLYYRLNVFKLSPPTLREIKDDIPVLVNHFINKYKAKYNSSAVKISDTALASLMNYSFPGNVRELENEIERALVMVGTEGDTIDVKHLSENIFNLDEREKTVNSDKRSMKELVENFEQDLIRKAVIKHRGNKTRAAKELGISRVGLNNKIQRYEIETGGYQNAGRQKVPEL